MINLNQPTKETLDSIIGHLKSGMYLIPDFQRDYDWSASAVQDLLISIFSDYYIGSLLFWNTSTNNIKALNCKQVKGFRENNETSQIKTVVLDGQQRLTSFYYAFLNPKEPLKNKKSSVEFFMKINEFLSDDIDKAFFYEWDNKKINKYQDIDYLIENKIFPMTNFVNVHDWDNAWTNKYASKYGSDETRKILEKLKNIKSYQIPIIYLKEDIDIAKVCDIFEKINSRGLKLSTFDLLNAILKQHDINLRTELWNDATDKLHFISEDNKMYILQNMSITEQYYCSPKYLYYLVPGAKKIVKNNDKVNEEKILINNKQDFLLKWNCSVNSIKDGENLLSDYSSTGYGVVKRKFLPYASMLPIFSALLSYLKKENIDTASNRQKLRNWWFYSIFSTNYSSSVESTMAKDYQDMIKWFKNEKNDKELEINSYNLDLKLQKEKTGAIYNSILNMIIINGGTDFYKNNSLSLNLLEDHHIVPKAFCKKLGIEDSKINSILNRTLISDDTNLNIQDDIPVDYIQNKILPKYNNDIESVKKILSSHFISPKAYDILTKNNFSKTDFDDFLFAREKAILNYIKENILIQKHIDSISMSIC